MEAKELRIGNIIKGISNIPEVVELICTDEVCTDYHESLKFNWIEPIPLTEEWLLKFGFYTDNDSWFYSLDYNKNLETFKICPLYSNEVHNGMFGLLNCQACEKKIRYVHQLQNLFFALTGEELEIKETILQN